MGLYRELQSLRLKLCHGRCARSRIFHNFAIRDMARRRPTNRENFLKVHGVGEKKLDRFGDLFIETIKRYCVAHSLETNVESTWDDTTKR
jgi:Superfamily II DNA helicase